jgi:hypothetical protein
MLKRNGASFKKVVFTFKHWLIVRVQKQFDLSKLIKAVQLIIGMLKMLQVFVGDTMVRGLVKCRGRTECNVYIVKWAGHL